MTKILVTGATGTIGRQTVRALREKGLAVRAAVRSPEEAGDLEKLGAEIAPFDFARPDVLARAFAGVDGVFLLTPFVEHFKHMVEAAVAAARTAGVKFILRTSAFGADPGSQDSLSAEHGQSENVVKESGLAWAIIQPTFMQDNLITYGGSAVRGQSAFYGSSHEGTTAYVSSADVGAVAAEILAAPDRHAGKTYVLTGPEAVADTQVARLASTAAGRQIRYIDLSTEQLAEGLRSQQTPEWMVHHIGALEAIKAAGWAAHVSPAVREILGRAPESYGDFLQRNRASLTA